MPSEACHSLDRGLRTARIIAFVCTYLGVGALLVHRVLHIHRLQSHRLPPAVRGFKPPQDIPGSWVFAASPNIFRNTLLLLRSTNVLYGLVAGPTVAALLGVYAVAGHQSRQGGCPEEIVRQCAGSEVCEFTIAWSILPGAASTVGCRGLHSPLLELPRQRVEPCHGYRLPRDRERERPPDALSSCPASLPLVSAWQCYIQYSGRFGSSLARPARLR